jgi:hypothetical protein
MHHKETSDVHTQRPTLQSLPARPQKHRRCRKLLSPNSRYRTVNPHNRNHLPPYLVRPNSNATKDNGNPDYEPIKQSQISWFWSTSQALRKAWEEAKNTESSHTSLVFQHIPLPEFGDPGLVIYASERGESSEGSSQNTCLYDALVGEDVAVIGCGHDHVNDFCALLQEQWREEGKDGPWLCYVDCAGFWAYCEWGGKRYWKRARVWELDAGLNDEEDKKSGLLRTWTRVEYQEERVDELVLC